MADERLDDDAAVAPAGIVGGGAVGTTSGSRGGNSGGPGSMHSISDPGETHESPASSGESDSGLPGDEVSVIEDRDATEGLTDSRGIMERIVDAAAGDDSPHIDRNSGPSI